MTLRCASQHASFLSGAKILGDLVRPVASDTSVPEHCTLRVLERNAPILGVFPTILRSTDARGRSTLQLVLIHGESHVVGEFRLLGIFVRLLHSSFLEDCK